MPERVVVLVTRSRSIDIKDKLYPELWGGNKIYLLKNGSRSIKRGDVVVLRCTYTRPSWYSSNSSNSVSYSYTNDCEDTYIWEIVDDE